MNNFMEISETDDDELIKKSVIDTVEFENKLKKTQEIRREKNKINNKKLRAKKKLKPSVLSENEEYNEKNFLNLHSLNKSKNSLTI